MTVSLADDDPRVDRIRTVLFAQVAADPIAELWSASRDEHRQVLVTLAAGEISQADLERKLGLTGVELRGLNGGLSKIAKRLGVDYPIRSVGAHRHTRRFSLHSDIAKQILKLSRKKQP